MISWTTLESFPLRVGISLPIQNPVNNESHETQLWEEISSTDEWIIESDHADFVYSWLSNRFAARSSARALPIGMPMSVAEVEVHTTKDGSYGYILFTPTYSFANSMKEMPRQVLMEYEEGFMKTGVEEAYTVRMIANDFWALTQQAWEFGPIGPIRRNLDGVVVHGISWDRSEFMAVIEEDEEVVPPPKILEERARGTVIRNLRSQGKLFQYWAWAQTPIEVGILVPNAGWLVEYWVTINLQPIPGDSDPQTYSREVQRLAFQRLREISDGIAQKMEEWEDDFRIITRYLYNNLRVWICPMKAFNAGVKRPLAEESCPKDKWISWTDIMAFSVPPIYEIENQTTFLFGPEARLQERYDDPEVQGGKIALIAVEQIRVQKPPNGLNRMQSTLLKQIAYNERVLEAEGEIAGINTEVPTFLSELSLDPEEKVYICVNGSVQMMRNEAAIAEQLWIQGDRRMIVANGISDGTAKTKDSAVLAAASAAVTWRPVQDAEGSRKGQRVIIYPKDLPQFEEVLRTGDPNVDNADGHPIVYEVILRESQTHEHPPIFLKEDSDHVLNDDLLSDKVQEWMAISQQVATGSNRRVLEDGIDVWNSSDEDDEKMKPDELTGMHTAEMDPKQGPQKLTQHQAAALRAAAKQSSVVPSEVSESECPPSASVFEDHDIKPAFDPQKTVNDAKKRLAVPRSPSAGNLATQKKGKSTTRSRAVVGP
jgi:hypothetical protein